jgi:hypothetical protein
MNQIGLITKPLGEPMRLFGSAMSAVVFKTMFSALMKFIEHHGILGKIFGFAWRIEYQKRSHTHTRNLS